ncbi:MAG TPA: DNA replication protein [Stellaceae bacterium]|jgi:chromosomal replication initiation ATPase DnaA
MTQLTLEWPPLPTATGRADFLASDSNRAALEQVERWPDWPVRGLVLYGPRGSGKTHLAHLWCEQAGGRLVEGGAVASGTAAEITGPVAIDDAERAPETSLLHLYNAAVERGFGVLIVAAQAPSLWPIALPDLASRMRALPVAEIAAPDDTLLAAVLVKHFADRQLRVGPGVIRFLLRRMERSFAAAARIVDGLDRLALARGGPVTVPLAKQIFAVTS